MRRTSKQEILKNTPIWQASTRVLPRNISFSKKEKGGNSRWWYSSLYKWEKYIKEKQKLFFKFLINLVLPSKHSSWWRRLEDVFCLCIQKTPSRRSRSLDLDEKIRLGNTSSEDVFKTSWSRRTYSLKTSWLRRIYLSWSYVFKTFQDAFKISLRLLQEVLP